MGNGATNKRKGNNAERYYAKTFRSIGYQHCQTSRFVSKKADNAKVDLVDIPFNIQIKAGLQKKLSPGKELLLMKASISSMYPPEDPIHSKPNLVVHYKLGTPENPIKREEESEIVYMSSVQFDKFKEINPNLEYLFTKKFKFDISPEFKIIVGMSFKYFIENIVTKMYNSNGSNLCQ